MSNDISRRQFLRGSCASALALGGLSVSTAANAEGAKLTEDDPTAMALGYKHDATTVDVEKHPKRAGDAGKDQFCKNCVLFGKEGDGEWAPCSLFQGRLVAGKGWCNAWVSAG
ncbi:MAG: high-potential iron-sulfur protein [Gammaproteobacteria bacterium]